MDQIGKLKSQAKDSFLYYLALGAMQAVLLFLWRRCDTTTFIFIPIGITSLVSVIILEMAIYFRFLQKINLGSNIIFRFLGSLSFCFLLFSNSVLNIDRSRSLFLIKWVDNFGTAGISIQDLKETAKAHSESEQAMLQRLEEQVEIGNVLQLGNLKFVLSNRGEFFVAVSNALASIYDLQNFKRETAKNEIP